MSGSFHWSSFLGHALPGTYFMLFALLLNLVHRAEQLEARDVGDTWHGANEQGQARGVCDDEHETRSLLSKGTGEQLGALAAGTEHGRATNARAVRTSSAKMKMATALFVICTISLGIAYEHVFHRKDQENPIHDPMYLSFLPAGVALGLESGLLPSPFRIVRHPRDASLSSQAALALGSLCYYFIVSGHATHNPSGGMANANLDKHLVRAIHSAAAARDSFHQAWASAAMMLTLCSTVSVLAQLAGVMRLASTARLACIAALNLQGSWLIFAGYELYGTKEPIQAMHVAAYFSSAILFWGVVHYVWYTWCGLLPPNPAHHSVHNSVFARSPRPRQDHDLLP
jgi:hypothetical protein